MGWIKMHYLLGLHNHTSASYDGELKSRRHSHCQKFRSYLRQYRQK